MGKELVRHEFTKYNTQNPSEPRKKAIKAKKKEKEFENEYRLTVSFDKFLKDFEEELKNTPSNYKEFVNNLYRDFDKKSKVVKNNDEALDVCIEFLKELKKIKLWEKH